MEISVIMFLAICGVMAATLKKYCCYGGCQGGGMCECNGLQGRINP